MTIAELAKTLKHAERTLSQAVDAFRETGQRCQKLQATRDQATDAITRITQQIPLSPEKTDELLEQLNRERERKASLSAQLAKEWADAGRAVQPVADLAHAAICAATGFQALEKHWLALPDEITRGVVDSARNLEFKAVA